MLRSIVAVAGGFVLWSALWIGGSRLIAISLPRYFANDGPAEYTGILLLLLGVSVAASSLSGYLTAAIAGREEIAHTTSLGAALLIVGIYLQSTFWNALPVWYHVSFAAFLVPGALLGGRIRLETKRAAPGTRTN
ncbi:MAG: hypothetical protein ACE5EM_07705 [Sphingomonadales bacterium]